MPSLLQIEDTLVSLDVIEKKFVCDLQRCKGICCVHGDSGAPLEKGEAEQLKRRYPEIEPFLRQEGREAIRQQGTSMVDHEGDLVTPLIEGRECAYTFIENGIYKCAVEKAWKEKRIPFRKPISCHLFPVRLKKFRDLTAVNFEYWKDCKPALELGDATGTYVYEFLREALIRRFGKKWYLELTEVAKAYHKQYHKEQ